MVTGTSDYGVVLSYATSTGTSFTAIGDIAEFGTFEFMDETIPATVHGSGGKKEYIYSKLMGLSEIPVSVRCTETTLNWAWDTMEDATTYWFALDMTNMGITNTPLFKALLKKGSIPSMVAENPKVFALEFTLQPTGDVLQVGA